MKFIKDHTVRKGWVDVPHGQVHFRWAGDGPPVVLLHDSPRSSVLHAPVVAQLADEFTAIALDTPGYGLSTPLPGPETEIPEFARALAATLQALGVGPCPIYAFHTSSKIALELAASDPQYATVTIMDGLSIPEGGADPEFIRRYMQPFEPSDDGSHVAAGWLRVRDFHRFFPWFAHAASNRLAMDLPDAGQLHVYATDLFMAGPHYRDAYGAAMRYDPRPAIGRLQGRSVFMCREDDVLFAHLDRLPAPLPAAATIERLPADRNAWLGRLRELLRTHVGPDVRFRAPDPLAAPADGLLRHGYVDLGAGQLRVRRRGRPGRQPLLLLHDVPGSGAQMNDLMAALASDRVTLAPDLPGLGESSPVPEAHLDTHADVLIGALARLGLEVVDVYAEYLAGPIALALAARAPHQVGRLVLDGLAMPGAAQRRSLRKHYCPSVLPQADGTHLLALWHRLRDQELNWPWYAHDRSSIRSIEPRIAADRLHAMLVDVMKQPDSYGTAARAAIDCDTRALLARVPQPVLLPLRAGDPRYAWVERAACKAIDARTIVWPDATDARAQVVREFLDA